MLEKILCLNIYYIYTSVIVNIKTKTIAKLLSNVSHCGVIAISFRFGNHSDWLAAWRTALLTFPVDILLNRIFVISDSMHMYENKIQKINHSGVFTVLFDIAFIACLFNINTHKMIHVIGFISVWDPIILNSHILKIGILNIICISV